MVCVITTHRGLIPLAFTHHSDKFFILIHEFFKVLPSWATHDLCFCYTRYYYRLTTNELILVFLAFCRRLPAYPVPKVLLSFRESVYYARQKHVTLITAYNPRQYPLFDGFPSSLFDFGRLCLIHRERTYRPKYPSVSAVHWITALAMLIKHSSLGYNCVHFKMQYVVLS